MRTQLYAQVFFNERSGWRVRPAAMGRRGEYVIGVGDAYGDEVITALSLYVSRADLQTLRDKIDEILSNEEEESWQRPEPAAAQ